MMDLSRHHLGDLMKADAVLRDSITIKEECNQHGALSVRVVRNADSTRLYMVAETESYRPPVGMQFQRHPLGCESRLGQEHNGILLFIGPGVAIWRLEADGGYGVTASGELLTISF